MSNKDSLGPLRAQYLARTFHVSVFAGNLSKIFCRRWQMFWTQADAKDVNLLNHHIQESLTFLNCCTALIQLLFKTLSVLWCSVSPKRSQNIRLSKHFLVSIESSCIVRCSLALPDLPHTKRVTFASFPILILCIVYYVGKSTQVSEMSASVSHQVLKFPQTEIFSCHSLH